MYKPSKLQRSPDFTSDLLLFGFQNGMEQFFCSLEYRQNLSNLERFELFTRQQILRNIKLQKQEN